MRHQAIAAVLFTLAALVSSAARANGIGALISPQCRTELATLCPKGGDRGARRQCIMTNKEKISAACKQELKTAIAQRKEQRGGGGHGNRQFGANQTQPTAQ